MNKVVRNQTATIINVDSNCGVKNRAAMVDMIIRNYITMLAVTSGDNPSASGIINFIAYYLDRITCYIQAVCAYISYGIILKTHSRTPLIVTADGNHMSPGSLMGGIPSFGRI